MAPTKKPDGIEIIHEICDICSACIAVCPPNVMYLTNNRLSIDFSGCTYCSLCIDICPVRALKGSYIETQNVEKEKVKIHDVSTR